MLQGALHRLVSNQSTLAGLAHAVMMMFPTWESHWAIQQTTESLIEEAAHGAGTHTVSFVFTKVLRRTGWKGMLFSIVVRSIAYTLRCIFGQHAAAIYIYIYVYMRQFVYCCRI